MGSLYTAACPCGFEQYDLLQGYGVNTRGVGYEIYQCEECHTLVNYELIQAADSLFKPLRCPQCRTTLRRLDSSQLEQPQPCPECRQGSLRLSLVGLWD